MLSTSKVFLAVFVLSARLLPSQAAPLRYNSRAVTSLDEAATAEAQQRDDTATRAFTGVPIKTADGQCLSVDPLGGDFRQNLIPVQAQACDNSPNQQWDVITAGKHNNVAGAALFVSTLTNGCLNFDPRRAAGNQVLLFSCGGRADGEGAVTDSQLFDFDQSSSASLALQPQNGKGQVCFKVVNGLLDQAGCDGSANQTFTIGESSAGAPPASTASAPASSDTTVPSPSTVEPVPAPSSTKPSILNPEAVAEAQQRDDTATRAFTGSEIKTSDGQCLSVDPEAGDFRENLIPVEAKACDGSANQQWDVITAGKHNNVAGAALFVSSLTNGCLNFDPRRAAGNQVLLFSCGGRADGEGKVTDSQLFDFDQASAGSLALQPQNGKGNVCFKVVNGLLDQAACDGSAEQTFSVGGSPSAPTPSSTQGPATLAPVESGTIAPAPTTVAPAPAPSSTKPSILNPEAVAEAHQRDDTATRAFTGSQIKTSDGQCLSVDPEGGDFRENLIPIQTKACDGSANQQWDVITAGKHNNVNGAALIVSTLTNGCMNFDPRRAAGNQVLLFSCGGRADGGGQTTDSQLFDLAQVTDGTLAPLNGKDDVCFQVKGGLVDQAACSGSAEQTFTIA
jgi:hypothetical protein